MYCTFPDLFSLRSPPMWSAKKGIRNLRIFKTVHTQTRLYFTRIRPQTAVELDNVSRESYKCQTLWCVSFKKVICLSSALKSVNVLWILILMLSIVSQIMNWMIGKPCDNMSLVIVKGSKQISEYKIRCEMFTPVRPSSCGWRDLIRVKYECEAKLIYVQYMLSKYVHVYPFGFSFTECHPLYPQREHRTTNTSLTHDLKMCQMVWGLVACLHAK